MILRLKTFDQIVFCEKNIQIYNPDLNKHKYFRIRNIYIVPSDTT